MTALPALRQIVLLAADLDQSLTAVRSTLGLDQGVREVEGMAALGFEHEVLAINETFVEIVSPLSADSSPGRLLARHGESGYMVVLQVTDLDAVLRRGQQIGLSPIMHERLDGNPISQWHPRDLGTLAEIDEIDDDRGWHFCPELSDTGSTRVVTDLVGAEIGVADPSGCARVWATLLDIDLADGATVLPLATGVLRFVESDGSARGLISADFASASPDSAERTICGVRLRIRASGSVPERSVR